MGMDYQTTRFLLESDFQDWDSSNVLTIGRQNWWLSRREARSLGLSFAPAYANDNYADEFWTKELGAAVESVDIVPDEKPTFLADLSVKDSLRTANGFKLYDVVCEFGTAEHVADQFAFWDNIAGVMRPKARLFVVVPCDGLAGHGLYQFSPEFFYRMCGFDVIRCGVYCYSPLGRYVPFDPLVMRFQKSWRWPTFVFAELMRTREVFERLPKQAFTTITHRRTPPWASKLVEIPGIRILERIIRR